MREIKVRGSATGTAVPNWIEISIEIISEHPDYQTVIDDLDNRTFILQEDIVEAGFDISDLKTTNLMVETNYRYENGTKIFVGYLAKHEMKLEFMYSKAKLDQAVYALGNSTARPSFNLTFTLEEREPLINQTLAKAIKDAETKANVIADSLNVRLGDVLEVNYESDLARPLNQLVIQEKALMSNDFIISPSDVSIEQTVYVVWQIENRY